ncbi:recombinase family protein (plasmid) [Kineococcus sp. DHX-1]|uniref:recombinase family protein n=1 Tax=Kineococcus sp. DHX-1 TaxID=3349638 RepID=UPI0036D31005
MVCLNLGVDTTAPASELQAHVVASMAHYEPRLIDYRTEDALAAKKAAGVRLGRPQSLPIKISQRVVEQRDAGCTWQSIANALIKDEALTARGGTTWRVHCPGTLRVVSRCGHRGDAFLGK